MQNYPYPKADGVRSIALGIIFSILTCGFYTLYWKYKQIVTLNGWLRRDEYSFWLWLILSIVTCSIFDIYYEYKMAKGINEIQRNNDHYVAKGLPGLCILFAIFDWIILGQIACLAIHQAEINKFYNARDDV